MERPLVFFLIVFLFLPLVLRAGTRQTTLVVYPLADGLEDEAAGKTAEVLRKQLEDKPDLKIIAPENVEAVLNYYRGFQTPASNAAEAKEFLNRAKEHYFQMDYATVRAELESVFASFKARPELLFTDGMILFDAWVTLGLVEAAQKKRDQAVSAFVEALRLHPSYQENAKAFSPSIRKLWEAARAGLGKTGPGRLQIGGTPKVADIYLNGIFQGVSPKTFDLPSGEYAVSFKANRYRGLKQTVQIRPGETLALEHKLYWRGKAQAAGQIETGSIAEGLRIADLLKVDKVLRVDVDEETIRVQMTDRKYRAAHASIVLPRGTDTAGLEEGMERLVRFVYAQTQLNLMKNPQAHLDPDGIGDPILLGGRRKKISRGVLWGGLGGIGVIGIVAGVLAGGGSGPGTGTVSVNFK